jgi:hypothetical protein
MKYEIWSNITRSSSRDYIPSCDGYRPGAWMEKTWSGEIEKAELTGNFLEDLFVLFNRDDRPNGASACSLSIGDVVVLDGNPYEVAPNGFRPVTSWPPVRDLNCGYEDKRSSLRSLHEKSY